MVKMLILTPQNFKNAPKFEVYKYYTHGHIFYTFCFYPIFCWLCME